MHDAWEGGRRHGVAWRHLAAAAGLLAAAIVLGWIALGAEQGLTVQTDRDPAPLASDEPEVVRQAPVRAGTRWQCPRARPVRAFAGGHFYPPEHPGVPDDTTRPRGCLPDAAAAEAAGYELAPAPPGATLVGGLYVVPAVAPSIEACGRVAATVRLAVPCPQQLPAPGRGISCSNTCLFYGDAAHPGVVIEQRGFPVPLDWCDGCDAHVVVAAVRDRSPPELVSCGPRMAAAAADGRPIAGYHECPAGPEWLPGIAGFPHERHTLLVWEDGPVAYALSMEGHAPQIRALLRTLRAGIAFVTPPG